MIPQEVPLDPNPACVISYKVNEPVFFFKESAKKYSFLRAETELFGEGINSRTGAKRNCKMNLEHPVVPKSSAQKQMKTYQRAQEPNERSANGQR